MRRMKLAVMMFMAPMATAMLMGFAGCVPVGFGPGPEWDGQLFIGGGGRDRHDQVFHAEGGNREGDRGRSSMGGRAGGGSPQAAHGGGHAGGGGHSGGGGKK
jgi:hypothetical protein